MSNFPTHKDAQAIRDIIAEMQRQDQLWGAKRDIHKHDFNLILSEEVGEVSEAAILAANAILGTKMGHVSKAVQGDEGMNLREELVQVAAVAAQWIEMIDRQACVKPDADVPKVNIRVCSNHLPESDCVIATTCGATILSIRGKSQPAVWLNGRNKCGSFTPVLNGGTACHPDVCLDITPHGLKATLRDTILIEIGTDAESGEWEVIELDLRPLGHNIFGDVSGMTVGNNPILRNTARPNETFITC